MIEYYEDESGEWRWRLKGANGEIVCTGEGHRDRHDAQRAVGIEPGWVAVERIVRDEGGNPVVVDGQSRLARDTEIVTLTGPATRLLLIDDGEHVP